MASKHLASTSSIYMNNQSSDDSTNNSDNNSTNNSANNATNNSAINIVNAAFSSIVPYFDYNIDGQVITVNVTPIEGAGRYVLYRKKGNGTYKYAAESASHIIEYFFDDDAVPYTYRVRAEVVSDTRTITTKYSKSRCIDIITAEKHRSSTVHDFFNSVKNVSNIMSIEDIETAILTLNLARQEAKERYERRQKEAVAEKKRQEAEIAARRRQAALKREEAIRLKKKQKHIEEITRIDIPLDLSELVTRSTDGLSCDNAAEALMLSLEMLGMVDIPFIMEVTGLSQKEVIESLKGSIYQNPLYWNEEVYRGWEIADEYLSGNVALKLRQAKKANDEYNGYFSDNVEALEELCKEELTYKDIYLTLGSPWIPEDIIDDFILCMTFYEIYDPQIKSEYCKLCSTPEYAVRHNSETGKWIVPEKSRISKSCWHGLFNENNTHNFGTERYHMLDLLEATLNNRTPSITDSAEPGNPNCTKRITNNAETIKVVEKQAEMKKVFQEWIWSDEHRRQRLEKIYNSRYGNFRPRKYSGAFLRFEGMSKDKTLYDYQKDSVARIISSPSTLLAHEVGSGKTYVMIAAGMELKRFDRSNKNLYVVPNGIISQWERAFKELYPESNVLTVTINNFNSKKKSQTISQIKNNDYDAILMTYSCFDMLPLSKKYKKKMLEEQRTKLEESLTLYSKKNEISRKDKQYAILLENLEKNYSKVPKGMCFDELGITNLFLDEAHNYKNIDIETGITMVRGLGNNNSNKCNSMLDKVHSVFRNRNGKVIFATGTPITNSISDIYTMQRYLQPGTISEMGYAHFDEWSSMFAEKTTDYEIDIDTNSYRLVSRFAKYKNVPELLSTLSLIIDYHKVDKTNGIPDFYGYTDTQIIGSARFQEYLKNISERADNVRNKKVTVREDNMLKITTDGRKAALDMRLVDNDYALDQESKVLACAENVVKLYENSRATKGTQLVFCDISTPRVGFNLYDDLKALLIAMGIPGNEIAYIHSAATSESKKKLFENVNKGDIAVLIGSTAKMGHGMNVQKRLVGLHHLDVPWKPSDMVQREGRILRQGNESEEVKIFRYITKGSFDAYSWQLLEIKQNFIGQVMSGAAGQRDGCEVDNTALSYGEVKALAVGNPKMKERAEIINEIDRYRILQNDYENRYEKNQRIIKSNPGKIAGLKTELSKCEEDIETYTTIKDRFEDVDKDEQRELRSLIYKTVWDNQNKAQPVFITQYRQFDIYVPAHMIPKIKSVTSEISQNGEKTSTQKLVPFVQVKGKHEYLLDIEAETGITTRLNNLLENGIEKIANNIRDRITELEIEMSNAENELSTDDGGYRKIIDELNVKLTELNIDLNLMDSNSELQSDGETA